MRPSVSSDDVRRLALVLLAALVVQGLVNRDPFLRLALIALGSLYAFAIATVAHFYGGGLAAIVLLGGIATAGAVSIVLEPKLSSDEPAEDLRQRRRQPPEGTRGFERIE